MSEIKIKGRKLSSFQIIILGFASVIFLGALILMLPFASQSGDVTSFSKALFTATSAVCVTGLVVVDTASYWSLFGQIVILILIQIGGLGVITVASFLSMVSGKNFSLLQRQTMQNALAAPSLGVVIRLTKFVLIFSVMIEVLGAFLLSVVFVPLYGSEGIWLSIFHSISAFCNAGFDLMGTKSGHFSSLTAFAGNGYLNLIICGLIIIGGIGFLTWGDAMKNHFRFREYMLQSKIIIITSLLLIIIPAIFFFVVDFAQEPMNVRIWKSVFQSVSPRTAGYNTADYMEMTEAGRAVTMILMLIGGSPGSTAGGIKTTTIAVLIANSIAVFRNKKDASCFGRRIDDSVVKYAATIFFLYAGLAMNSAIIISLVEDIPMQTCMFETFSAIGTAGLTMGITSSLGLISRIVLMLLMFFGRVGGLTVVYAAYSRKDAVSSKYPVENVIVG